MSAKRLSIDSRLTAVEAKLDDMKEDLQEMKELLRGEYITRAEFAPVRAVFYGMVGVILLAVMGALVALVLR